ncbi:DUF7220 family protein [Bradyrhizobium diazoefficiens]|uniref:Uncharacterized protein n=2 Tax=Bradyrhizobium diazoefficiens TaxID=1355477 RepID=A0A809YNZ3_9BRAD|nr:hypothetical protein H12S4_49650 [Bradyrhizobium diazoefficiens]BCA21420.1 hypothetical protein BDHH15_46350 [Bradyrhizobium diazoefficiens]BCE39588.1 hypothetical protein XF3B_46190 [Bradyrhizobium diazoefficiens]BCF52985.1 hypothetical protein XF17B_46230 [Bradyrhizobium diazoefficiens]
MKQSKIMSLVESVINIAVGFGISLAAQMYFLPLLGVTVSFRQNLFFALIMTVISIARSYLLRRVFEALHIRRPLSSFMQAVIAERFRQIEQEGWSTTHDDAHPVGELAAAGSCYAIMPTWRRRADDDFGREPPIVWPWSLEWWKPQGNRRDLVRAAALVVAEGEKFDRNRGRK